MQYLVLGLYLIGAIKEYIDIELGISEITIIFGDDSELDDRSKLYSLIVTITVLLWPVISTYIILRYFFCDEDEED